MQLEKIDIDNVHNNCLSFDETERSLKTFAYKINEIIDVLNEKKELKCTYCDFKTEEKNEKFMNEHMDIKHFHPKNDWEKEVDKEFGYLVDESGSCDDLEKIKQFIHNLLK